jgi:hypothetical protein
MSEVTRDEFDRLVERVVRVERTLGATVEIMSSELVGLRTYLDERFAAVDARFDGIDARFDHQDRMIDALATEIQVDLDSNAARVGALLRHFGIDDPA